MRSAQVAGARGLVPKGQLVEVEFTIFWPQAPAAMAQGLAPARTG